MNIFVTVGTTPFDKLIEKIDMLATEHNIILQISENAKYIPINLEYIHFTKEINEYFDKADLIITHAGAGNIYNLLELNKKILVVPNLERIDVHQMDLANYVKNESFAFICTDISIIQESIERAVLYKTKKYEKEIFFKFKEIVEYLNIDFQE